MRALPILAPSTTEPGMSQKRVTIIKSRIGELHGTREKAIAARKLAMAEVSHNPADSGAYQRLTQALSDVQVVDAALESLNEALDEAARHDRVDRVAERAADAVAAREKAAGLARDRVAVAAKLDALLAELAPLLREFDSLNAAARMQIDAAAVNLYEPDDFNAEHYGLQLNAVREMLRLDVPNQFAIALKRAGLGHVGINLDGLLEYPVLTADLHAHRPRTSLAEAVDASADAVACTLENWHRLVGLEPKQ